MITSTIGSYIKDYPTLEAAEKDKEASFKGKIEQFNKDLEGAKVERKAFIIASAIAAILVVGAAIALAVISGGLMPLFFTAVLIVPAYYIYKKSANIAQFSDFVDMMTKLGPSKISLLEYRKDRTEAVQWVSNASLADIAKAVKDTQKSEPGEKKYTLNDLVAYRLLDNSSIPASDAKIQAFYKKAVELITQATEANEVKSDEFNAIRASVYS